MSAKLRITIIAVLFGAVFLGICRSVDPEWALEKILPFVAFTSLAMAGMVTWIWDLFNKQKGEK